MRWMLSSSGGGEGEGRQGEARRGKERQGKARKGKERQGGLFFVVFSKNVYGDPFNRRSWAMNWEPSRKI